MSSPEEDLRAYIQDMTPDQKKDLYTELSRGSSGSTSMTELYQRFGSIPSDVLKTILEIPYDIPVYFVLGHGQEDEIEYDDRNVLPKGYTLITEAQCGKVTYLHKLETLIDASHTVDHRLLANPTKQLLKDLTGSDYYIYREGDKVPSVRFSAFATFPSYGFATLSGIHKLPIQPNIPYEDIRIPIDQIPNRSDEIFTKSTVFPKPQNIKDFLQTKPYTQYPILELSKIMKVLGPGTYYFPICRALPPFSQTDYVQFIQKMETINPTFSKTLEALVASQPDPDKIRKTLLFLLEQHLRYKRPEPEETVVRSFLASLKKSGEFVERTRSKSTLRQKQIAGLRKNGKKKTRRRRHHGVQSRKHHS